MNGYISHLFFCCSKGKGKPRSGTWTLTGRFVSNDNKSFMYLYFSSLHVDTLHKYCISLPADVCVHGIG